VHITVTRTGYVVGVGPSLRAVSIPNRFEAEFQQAVLAALAQWRFEPAQTYHIEVARTATGEPICRETLRRKAVTDFDLVFTFTASGKVQVAPTTAVH
jgi:ABC-type lipoprotein release transport system permease subunit